MLKISIPFLIITHNHYQDQKLNPDPVLSHKFRNWGAYKGAMKILIVDYDTVILNSLKSLLTSSGFEVSTAKNGDHALRVIRSSMGRSESISLMMIELKTPDMSGVELARSARKLIPNLSVIFMTGYADDHIRKEVSQFSHCCYVQKPFSLNTLLEAINQKRAFSQ